jgi:hypothetical protein
VAFAVAASQRAAADESAVDPATTAGDPAPTVGGSAADPATTAAPGQDDESGGLTAPRTLPRRATGGGHASSGGS